VIVQAEAGGTEARLKRSTKLRVIEGHGAIDSLGNLSCSPREQSWRMAGRRNTCQMVNILRPDVRLEQDFSAFLSDEVKGGGSVTLPDA
jgi:Tol biopolymer transport system component